MGKFKEIAIELMQLEQELGREPTREEMEQATEEYIQSYNKYLDSLENGPEPDDLAESWGLAPTKKVGN